MTAHPLTAAIDQTVLVSAANACRRHYEALAEKEDMEQLQKIAAQPRGWLDKRPKGLKRAEAAVGSLGGYWPAGYKSRRWAERAGEIERAASAAQITDIRLAEGDIRLLRRWLGEVETAGE
ncbi:hypothetical protein BAJUN_00760 [Bajunvirus bajun]|uniref:Uncharacterized protein n=1 Tax=Brevundimonas phage vB_BgoS-Bajun TaxID=2948594 RepID=A0A9E7ST83_9CAUD|nr:hypothetical protein BAJUN_00760 [Brevundimonas phage vB_BgoS-Bajun]